MATLPSTLLIGTRKSPLALAQANQVKSMLEAARPELAGKATLVPIITTGDSLQQPLLAELGGKGLFTKEIEDALLKGELHLAVHSMKDMPTALPSGLMIGAVPKREDARDVLIGAKSFAAMPEGASFASASLRRAAQAKIKRPDLKIVPLRGNVETRLRKIKDGEAHATMLALAGLKRLGITPLPGTVMPAEEILPAVGQGALCIECSEKNIAVRDLLAEISDAASMAAITAERAMLAVLDGSCRTPIAGYATVNDTLSLRGLVAQPDGSEWFETAESGNAADAFAIGEAAGHALKRQAGDPFFEALYG